MKNVFFLILACVFMLGTSSCSFIDEDLQEQTKKIGGEDIDEDFKIGGEDIDEDFKIGGEDIDEDFRIGGDDIDEDFKETP